MDLPILSIWRIPLASLTSAPHSFTGLAILPEYQWECFQPNPNPIISAPVRSSNRENRVRGLLYGILVALFSLAGPGGRYYIFSWSESYFECCRWGKCSDSIGDCSQLVNTIAYHELQTWITPTLIGDVHVPMSKQGNTQVENSREKLLIYKKFSRYIRTRYYYYPGK